MLNPPTNHSIPAQISSKTASCPILKEPVIGLFSKKPSSALVSPPFPASFSSSCLRSQPWHLFPGPKDWLKEQKKKSIKYLLAPIDASLDLLQYARQLLLSEGDDKQDREEIQGMLRAAARDCVPEERNSFVAFQSKTGVEVCTFKLIVKNASSLLDDNDPTKVKAEEMLGDLIRSFTVLNGVAKEANIQLVSDREKIADALEDTISSLHKFEEGIKGCIEL